MEGVCRVLPRTTVLPQAAAFRIHARRAFAYNAYWLDGAGSYVYSEQFSHTRRLPSSDSTYQHASLPTHAACGPRFGGVVLF